MLIISDNGYQASARAVRVVRLISTTDSRTERLCELLTVSISHSCIVCTCLIQLSVMSAGFSRK